MEARRIKEIIAKGENQEVELRESFHSAQDVSKAICALANTTGGLLFLGVSDDGEVIGLKESLDKVQQKIAAANQSIYPTPLISVETCEVDGKNIIVAIIQRPADNSYYTYQGAIYVRVGSTIRRLDGGTHLEFLRNRQILSFEESYDAVAKIENIDEAKIRSYLKMRKQEDYLDSHTVKDFLISSRLASENGALKIKNSAILLFGKNPVLFYPQIEIKLAQFSGKEPVNIISHQLIQEDLVNLIEQSAAFVKSHIRKAIKIKGVQREEVYEYPESVIREAIVNAVAHRDYFSNDSIQIYVFENRIEITNPGSLPQGLPEELFGTISVQRNPIIYRFLRDMGYVEGLGTGIPRMKNEMRNSGLYDPDFKFTESFFRVILYNKKGSKKPIESVKDLSERQQKAIEYLHKHNSIKAKTYAAINKVSHATAVGEINELIEYGYLRKVGAFRGAYYVLHKDGG